MSIPIHMKRFVNIKEFNDNDPKQQLKPDTKIKIKLKPHQETILKAAIDLENKIPKRNSKLEVTSKIGVLCDKVGSGKSLEILSIIDSNPLKDAGLTYEFVHNLNNTVCYKNLILHSQQEKIIHIPINIIVVPYYYITMD